MERKAIVAAAIAGGVHTPAMTPYPPVAPRRIVDESVRAREAGAAICHIHVRNPETGRPSPDVTLVEEVMAKIESRCRAIVCFSTGGGIGMTVKRRVRPVRVFKPELDALRCRFHRLCQVSQNGKIQRIQVRQSIITGCS